MNKTERYRFYWLGKSPTVRKAVEHYLHQPFKATDTWKSLAAKYGISEVALRNNVKQLQRLHQQGYLEVP